MCSISHRIKLFNPTPLASLNFCRHIANSPDKSLLIKLRRETQVSLTKAREALLASNNDYNKAISWLQTDLLRAGQDKAAKLSQRAASDGLIICAATADRKNGILIELNCETDFVSRSDIFNDLALRIQATSLLLHNDLNVSRANGNMHALDMNTLSHAPLLPKSSDNIHHQDISSSIVKDGLLGVMRKLGENIVLRRGVILNSDIQGGETNQNTSSIIGKYSHGNMSGLGKVASLVQLRFTNPKKIPLSPDIGIFADRIAQHVVGCNPLYLSDVPLNVKEDDEYEINPEDAILNRQTYLFGGGTVSEIVKQEGKKFGFDDAVVSHFVRYECGESI